MNTFNETFQLGTFEIKCPKCKRRHKVRAEAKLSNTQITVNIEAPEDCDQCRTICTGIAKTLANSARDTLKELMNKGEDSQAMTPEENTNH